MTTGLAARVHDRATAPNSTFRAASSSPVDALRAARAPLVPHAPPRPHAIASRRAARRAYPLWRCIPACSPCSPTAPALHPDLQHNEPDAFAPHPSMRARKEWPSQPAGREANFVQDTYRISVPACTVEGVPPLDRLPNPSPLDRTPPFPSFPACASEGSTPCPFLPSSSFAKPDPLGGICQLVVFEAPLLRRSFPACRSEGALGFERLPGMQPRKGSRLRTAYQHAASTGASVSSAFPACSPEGDLGFGRLTRTQLRRGLSFGSKASASSPCGSAQGRSRLPSSLPARSS